MGIVRQLKKRSRQNALIEENIKLRHLGRFLWTALEEYANPTN